MNKKYHLTEEHLSDLKRNYHNTPTSDLTLRYNCSISCIYNLAFKYELKKDIDFIRNTSRDRITPEHGGVATRFQKGCVPKNKGLKQIDFMSEEGLRQSKITRFKKGHTPQNHKPIGYERICSKDGYIYIKTAEPHTFSLKHRLIYEQHNGPIPKGYNIQFKDKNRQNTDINNLYLISRSDQLKNENTLYRYPEELVSVIKLKGKLKRQINKKQKYETRS